MNRRPALLLAFCLLGLGLVSSPAQSPATAKPNVLFIFADDLGWGDLGCYGNTLIKTPNLDRLAQQGTLFTHFYVNASVCSPSRTAFMTGQYPARHRVHGHFATHEQNAARDMPNWLDPQVTTLPRLLQQAGYATAHFGKWHLGGGTGAPAPKEYGFHETRTLNSNGPTWEETDTSFRAKSTAAFVDETLKFVQANKGKPFYVNLWTLLPHATLNPTEEQMAPYERFGPGGKGFPHKGAAQIYYASVTDLDTQVGRLMKGLEDLGVADNTLILFSSDNGPEDMHISNASHSGIGSAGPFRGRKRSLYEGGIRVPGIVRWPGKVPANRIDEEAIVSGVDWLPTVCKLAGVNLPKELKLDGEDMSAALLGKNPDRTKPLMWEWRFRIAGEPFHQSPQMAIREGAWKLLMNTDRSRVELYDVKKDLTQLNNISEKHPDIVQRLSERLLAWQKELPPGRIDPGAGQMNQPWPGKKPAAGQQGKGKKKQL